MPHKVVKKGNKWAVRSWITGKLLKRRYASKKAAENAAKTSYRRSKRKRHTGRRK